MSLTALRAGLSVHTEAVHSIHNNNITSNNKVIVILLTAVEAEVLNAMLHYVRVK